MLKTKAVKDDHVLWSQYLNNRWTVKLYDLYKFLRYMLPEYTDFIVSVIYNKLHNLSYKLEHFNPTLLKWQL